MTRRDAELLFRLAVTAALLPLAWGWGAARRLAVRILSREVP